MAVAANPLTTSTSEAQVSGLELGALLCGVFGTIAAGVGLWCLGMSGLVWKDGQFWGSSSWSDESELAISVGAFFFGIWAILMLIAIVLALAGAHRAQGRERRSLLVTASVVPLISIALILVTMPIFLDQGGAQLIPLDRVLR